MIITIASATTASTRLILHRSATLAVSPILSFGAHSSMRSIMMSSRTMIPLSTARCMLLSIPRTAALSRSRIFFLTKNPLIWFSMATIGTKFEPKQQNRLSFREPVSFCLFFINKHRTAQNWGLQMSLIYFCAIRRIALMYLQDFVLLVVHIA